MLNWSYRPRKGPKESLDHSAGCLVISNDLMKVHATSRRLITNTAKELKHVPWPNFSSVGYFFLQKRIDFEEKDLQIHWTHSNFSELL